MGIISKLSSKKIHGRDLSNDFKWFSILEKSYQNVFQFTADKALGLTSWDKKCVTMCNCSQQLMGWGLLLEGNECSQPSVAVASANILEHKRRRRWKRRTDGGGKKWSKPVWCFILLHSNPGMSFKFLKKKDNGDFHEGDHQCQDNLTTWQSHMSPFKRSRGRRLVTTHRWHAWENWTWKNLMQWKQAVFSTVAATGHISNHYCNKKNLCSENKPFFDS